MMMRTKTITENEIAGIMAKAWGISAEEIPRDVKFGEMLQWDSMGHVALLALLESEFNIELTYEILTELTSMAAILTHLKKES